MTSLCLLIALSLPVLAQEDEDHNDAESAQDQGSPADPFQDSIERMRFGTSSTVQRSTAPDIVVDTLTILAELAHERAKTRAYEIVQARIQTAVCEELKLDEEQKFSLEVDLGGISGKVELTLPAGPLLPATCDLVRSTSSVVDLVGRADDVADAIVADLVNHATSLVGQLASAIAELEGGTTWTQAQVRYIFEELALVASESILDGEPLDQADAQALVIDLSRHDWVEGVTNDQEAAVGLALKVAFAVAAECSVDGQTCDAGSIASMVAEALEEYDGWDGYLATKAEGLDLSAIATGYQGLEPHVRRLATDVLRLLEAGRRDTDVQVSAAIDIAFDVLELVLETLPSTGQQASGGAQDLQPILDHFREALQAAAEQDPASATLHLAEIAAVLLEQAKEDELLAYLRRVLPVVTTLASNAQSLEQAEANPEQAEALREARKEALEALIAASTQRKARDGELVVSLGANVGLMPTTWSFEANCRGDTPCNGGRLMYSGVGQTAQVPQTVTMPMGLALQMLPRSREEIDGVVTRKWAPGVHGQLSVVDLIQFLPDDSDSDDGEIQWSEFLLLGAQVGVGLGPTPQDNFVIGVDGRYAPYADDLWQLGIFASYYVPFFDLN